MMRGKLLVTGGSGFVGKNLVPGLAVNGFSGVVVGRRELAGEPCIWPRLIRADVLDARKGGGDGVLTEVVVHLEVKHHVDQPTQLDAKAFWSVNVEGTREWLDWCRRYGVTRFVLFSTIKAVGCSEQACDEYAEFQPDTLYGESKRAAENLVREWASESSRHSALILRSAVIYGSGNSGNVFSLVNAIDKGRFFLVGRNDNIKSLISIANLVGAVSHLLRRPAPGLQVYNLVDRESFSVRQIAEMVATELGRPGPVRSIPPALAWLGAETGELCRRLTGRSLPLTRSRLKAMQETTHFSAEKLMSTGFVHPQTTQEGLREMVAWFLSAKANGFRDVPGRGPRA